MNKTNRCTELQLYWYDDYMFQAAFLPIIRSSGLHIGFGTLYAVVVTVCYQEWDGILFLVVYGHHNCI
jgi:hypothetical protein